ncbi:MAG: preprotein translocase subunit SecE [Sphaerochaetaceae bacterium]|jgi:preprotein translocase subunit SecE|nr:preprotein translocase subunit SecE [Spirochaetaceae bacterium]MDY6344358.1 preprotein translocase subunit SecE [Sphaerochaetaceae bacterium]
MKKLIQYFKDCRSELRKVVWPSKENVASSTKVVVISTVLVAVFLGLVDFVLLKLVYLLF